MTDKARTTWGRKTEDVGVMEDRFEGWEDSRLFWAGSLTHCIFCLLWIDTIIHDVYREQIKWEVQRRHTCGCRCHERLKGKTEGCTWLTYTGFREEVLVLGTTKRSWQDKPLKIHCWALSFPHASILRCLLWSNKARAKQKTYKSVGVMKD